MIWWLAGYLLRRVCINRLGAVFRYDVFLREEITVLVSEDAAFTHAARLYEW